jgi:TonB-dependent starch-binding outer membrane protein SusC
MKKGIILLMVLILPLSGDLFAQKTVKRFSITGQVLDANEKPVADAMILVDNNNTNVVTNGKGMFKVKVKSDATRITVFKLNCGQQEEEIKGRTVINFRLPVENLIQAKEDKEKSENEQINVGYGTNSKKNLTTSTTKIEGKNKEFVAYNSIYEMLQRDPSVQVSGKKIVIRGVGTINTNDPLLVVDGMIVNTIDDISPKTVKSIEILKGADAAIYGSRGASGVILITLIH